MIGEMTKERGDGGREVPGVQSGDHLVSEGVYLFQFS